MWGASTFSSAHCAGTTFQKKLQLQCFYIPENININSSYYGKKPKPHQKTAQHPSPKRISLWTLRDLHLRQTTQSFNHKKTSKRRHFKWDSLLLIYDKIHDSLKSLNRLVFLLVQICFWTENQYNFQVYYYYHHQLILVQTITAYLQSNIWSNF